MSTRPTRINGADPRISRPPQEIKPDPDKQVWGCGACQAQGHRLLPDGVIECGQCTAESAFEHYEPFKKSLVAEKHRMRMRQSRADNRDNWICGRCGHNRFHLQQSGTLTCYRCRHAANRRWWNPVTGEPAHG